MLCIIKLVSYRKWGSFSVFGLNFKNRPMGSSYNGYYTSFARWGSGFDYLWLHTEHTTKYENYKVKYWKLAFVLYVNWNRRRRILEAMVKGDQEYRRYGGTSAWKHTVSNLNPYLASGLSIYKPILLYRRDTSYFYFSLFVWFFCFRLIFMRLLQIGFFLN